MNIGCKSKSCFNGKGTLGSLDSNNKKARVFNLERWRLFKVAEMSIGYNKIKKKLSTIVRMGVFNNGCFMERVHWEVWTTKRQEYFTLKNEGYVFKVGKIITVHCFE